MTGTPFIGASAARPTVATEYHPRDRAPRISRARAEVDVPSVFTRIIQGELPGRFVWRDEHCVAFLSINPLRPGHVLVVPRAEIDHWLDLDAELLARLTAVSQEIGRALQSAFGPEKVGLMIAGLEVRHVHLHVVPIHDLRDLDFARADKSPSPQSLDDAARKVRAALRAQGAKHVADE
jgi:histidine triad (HIT) family protein